ncbi:hypothetical protein PG987_000559 [Apiospora arundinis]
MFWAAGNGSVATLRKLASLSSDLIQSHTAKLPNQTGEKKIIQARFLWINLDDFDAKQQDESPGQLNFGLWRISKTEILPSRKRRYFPPLEVVEDPGKSGDQQPIYLAKEGRFKMPHIYSYFTPLQIAAASGDTDVLEFLLSKAAPSNTIITTTAAIEAEANLDTCPLSDYNYSGNPLERLLFNDSRRLDERVPLNDSRPLEEMLLKNDTNYRFELDPFSTRIRFARMASPLYAAILHGKAETASLLLRRGASTAISYAGDRATITHDSQGIGDKTSLLHIVAYKAQPAVLLRVLVEEARIPVDGRDLYVELGADVDAACYSINVDEDFDAPGTTSRRVTAITAGDSAPGKEKKTKKKSLLAGLINGDNHKTARPWRAAARLVKLGPKATLADPVVEAAVEGLLQDRTTRQLSWASWMEDRPILVACLEKERAAEREVQKSGGS